MALIDGMAPPVIDLEAGMELEENRRLAREVRAVFKYQAARMLYPTLLGFCLAARLGRFNLMVPSPNLNTTPAAAAGLSSPEDLWRTDLKGDVFILAFTFIVVSAVHMFLASYLVIKAPDGAPSLSRKVAWIPPVVFWAVTTLYFMYFAKVARYGPARGEWTGASVASFVILVATLYMIWSPVEASGVIDDLEGEGGVVKAMSPKEKKEGGAKGTAGTVESTSQREEKTD